jgi:hypothetical protein
MQGHPLKRIARYSKYAVIFAGDLLKIRCSLPINILTLEPDFTGSQ